MLSSHLASRPGETAKRGFWQRWAVAWKVKWRGSAYRINFDLHRAGGLWTWAMLFVFAWFSVAFNLSEEVYMPVMTECFGMKDPLAYPPELPQPRPDPRLDWRTAQGIGQRLMAEQSGLRGVAVQHESGLYYSQVHGAFFYSVHSDLDVGEKLGNTLVAFDGDSGEFLAFSAPTSEDAGSTFSRWITNLHMAQVFGLGFQIFVCFMGLGGGDVIHHRCVFVAEEASCRVLAPRISARPFANR